MKMKKKSIKKLGGLKAGGERVVVFIIIAATLFLGFFLWASCACASDADERAEKIKHMGQKPEEKRKKTEEKPNRKKGMRQNFPDGY